MTTYESLNTVVDFDGGSALVARAADNAISAAEPIQVADRGLLVRHPNDWVAEVIDQRLHEDHPRERTGNFKFAAVESLVRYVNRFSTPNTLGYITDVTGKGTAALTADLPAVNYVLDDFHPEAERVANRRHGATLVLRPTTAARRWGAAFGQRLSQVQMVELVIDGTGEIAAPDSADLRDLISDLHAIRTASAKSVVRASGGLAVEIAENVALHAGIGNLVQVPESLTLVLQPWTAIDATVTVDVKIRPNVNGETVTFGLTAPHLEEALNEVLRTVHAQLADTANRGTGIEPLWTA